MLNKLSPGFLYLVLALVLAGLFFLHEHSMDREVCQQLNEVRAEVDERTDEINGIRNAIGFHLSSRLAGDKDLIAEGPGAVRDALAELDGVEAAPVSQEECPGLLG